MSRDYTSTMSSKYAALPDLDNSQDIYETPDLTSDVSTAPGTTLPDIDDASSSAGSSTSSIDATPLQPSDAAKRFLHAEVDASDVDFSDRIDGGRSYKVRRKWEGETREMRIARLVREVEEVRAQEVGEKEGEGDGVKELAQALEMLVDGAPGRLKRLMEGRVVTATKEVPPGVVGEGGEAEKGEDMESGTTSTYTVTYAPDYKKTHTLAKVAEFDDRITFLEKVLGMSALTLDADSDSLLAPAMIPHLEELSRQMTVLNSSTTSSLDSASRRVKQLTADTEKLAEARKAAKTEAVTAEEDDETTAKINALYGVLPTIESMKPLLPALLDRLRSLRAVHQDAARAAEILVAVEKRQEEMAAEILKWEETLGKVEEVVKTSGQTVEGNMVKVETWVREIEKKMEALR